MQKSDGMNYAPIGSFHSVCEPGEFVFAAAALDHGHIYGMCNGLKEAGAELKWVYDPDPVKVDKFVSTYPEVRVAASLEQILQDPEVKLVASAAIPSDRGPLGLRVMSSGKDYFTDKAPFTTLEQLEAARTMFAQTGQKFAVYYSERLHVESSIYAGQLIEQGAIGRVLQVIGLGPHRISLSSRPDWFFDRERFGGILCDIGSHQIEQFLYFTGAKDAKVVHSKVANYQFPQHPTFEDFGDATLIADNGATGYFRVDWLTPDGLSTWGDGRMTILGTEGYIELRKYVDIARDKTSDHVYLVNKDGEQHFAVNGQVGFPYFGQLILDCLQRTELAMTQEHTFKAAELCLIAQRDAIHITQG
ncbi:Gfo/Idh/MocA family protein [Paenibacillus marchantiophytorum]|uniref:Gfo/Idh/MocA family protein n=1 Tax=Paenibacillus marchantiophytorum TaxID=1619310 RepID=UPI0016695E51|nr:Gfo/Idh/MocA family oxidoreductase [Paenibacillus marchantiophytorum]